MNKDIFENIESEKRIDLNDRLWQRVEDKLDVNKYKSKSNKYKWIAAAAMFVIAISVTINYYPTSTRSNYRVTDFSIENPDKNPTLNPEQQTMLQKLYKKLDIDCFKKDKYSC